jgi:hypothetical protein
MDKLKKYKNYFELIDERTPFSLFKKYVFELIELAEDQQNLPKLETDELILKLYSYLGTSVDLDFNLWKETEKYCKENSLIEAKTKLRSNNK